MSADPPPSLLDRLLEPFFGPRLTPAQVLANTLADLKEVARGLRRQATRAERELARDAVKIANLRDADFAAHEAQIRQLVRQQVERQRVVGLYLARAGAVDRSIVHLGLQKSEVDLLSANLRGSLAIIRFGASLPTDAQVQRIVAAYEKSAARQEVAREGVADAMGSASDALLGDDQDDQLLSGDSVDAETERELHKMREAAGLADADDLARDLPEVPRGRVRGQAPLGDGRV
jgi:hypothetical protein